MSKEFQVITGLYNAFWSGRCPNYAPGAVLTIQTPDGPTKRFCGCSFIGQYFTKFWKLRIKFDETCLTSFSIEEVDDRQYEVLYTIEQPHLDTENMMWQKMEIVGEDLIELDEEIECVAIHHISLKRKKPIGEPWPWDG